MFLGWQCLVLRAVLANTMCVGYSLVMYYLHGSSTIIYHYCIKIITVLKLIPDHEFSSVCVWGGGGGGGGGAVLYLISWR